MPLDALAQREGQFLAVLAPFPLVARSGTTDARLFCATCWSYSTRFVEDAHHRLLAGARRLFEDRHRGRTVEMLQPQECRRPSAPMPAPGMAAAEPAQRPKLASANDASMLLSSRDNPAAQRMMTEAMRLRPRHPVGCAFDFRLGAAPSRFAATRRARRQRYYSAPHVTNSSGSSNSRSGARQKERSMVQPSLRS